MSKTMRKQWDQANVRNFSTLEYDPVLPTWLKREVCGSLMNSAGLKGHEYVALLSDEQVERLSHVLAEEFAKTESEMVSE